MGLSKEPLLIKQIEKEVSKDFQGGERPNYVYELTERLFPIGSKQYSYQKFKKLLNSDEILKVASYVNSNEYHLAIDEETTKKIKHKIFESYYNFFKIYNKLIDRDVGESDLEINVSEPSFLDNEKSITIKVSDKNNNYVKIIIKCIEPIDKKNINEQTINIQFLQKSTFSNGEKKMNIIKMMHGSNNHNKKIDVYSSKLSAVNLKPTYLDVLPKDIPENIPKDFDPKELKVKLKYVLNLRGFVEFLLLCGYNNSDYKKIDKVIENLSYADEYISLNQEIGNRFSIQNPNVYRNLSTKEIFSTKKNLKNIDINYLSSHKVKNRFPFLAFYNEYKNFFKPYLIAKTLKRIADSLKPVYKNENISELKYKFTYEYLQFVKRLLSPRPFASTSLSSMKAEELQGFSKFFKECSLYVEITRIRELDLELDSYDRFNEQIKTANIEKKYKQIIENNEDFVSN